MSNIHGIIVGSSAEQPIEDATATASNKALFQMDAHLYEGVDLTVKYATEIAGYSDAWAWMKYRINNQLFDGLRVGDYIPITMNGYTVKMQIAGIDTFYRTTDQEVKHHIDFISKDCYPETVKWNTTDNNNGTATNIVPYMASNIKTWITGTLYGYLPAAVKSVITNKRTLMGQRYSSGGALTDDTGWEWDDLGPLWIPLEYEVFGAVVCGTKMWSEGQAVQYPIFANNWKNRIKGAGDGASRCYWWLASVASGWSTDACGVTSDGNASLWGASSALYVPVCFRVMAS